jgi:hypothetical protein
VAPRGARLLHNRDRTKYRRRDSNREGESRSVADIPTIVEAETTAPVLHIVANVANRGGSEAAEDETTRALAEAIPLLLAAGKVAEARRCALLLANALRDDDGALARVLADVKAPRRLGP